MTDHDFESLKRGLAQAEALRSGNALEYKGYYATVEFDADDMILVGRIAGINDVVGFHAEDAEGLRLAFEEAVEGYLNAKGAKTKLIPFEAEHHFKTDEDVDFLVSDALASGDESYIARAREIAARKRKGCE